MKNSIKRKVLVVFSTILLAMICSLICMNLPMTKAYAAGTAFTEPQDVTVAAKDAGFAVTDGASVRVSTAGIKFTTTVTEDYHNDISEDGTYKVTYFAVARKAGGASQRINFAATPDFSVNKKYHEYNTYLNFDAYQEANKDNAELLAAAYATEFEIDTYAEVTEGEKTVYYKAYQTVDNARSMRVVANAAQLKGEDANALAQYYTAQDRTTDEMAYVDANGNGKLVLPKLSGGETYVGAYVGTKNVTDAVVDNEISLSNIDVTDMTSGSTKDVSAFTSTGRVISRKMAFADTVIKADNVSDLLSVTGGYVVIAEDIDMATAYDGVWTGATDFVGYINGLGYEISNLKTGNGLFANFYGYGAKNLAITNFVCTDQSGVFGEYTNRDNGKKITFENLYVHFSANCVSGWYIGLLGRANLYEDVTITDSVLVSDHHSYGDVVGHAGTYKIYAFNTYFVNANEYGSSEHGADNGDSFHIAATSVTYDYANKKELAAAYMCGDVDVEWFIEEQLAKVANEVAATGVKFINKTNVADLLTTTSGTIYITEDIDMAEVCASTNGLWTAPNTAKFHGVFDGLGHTIKNLKVPSSGLFYAFSGTLSNISFVDAKVTNQGGVIAYTEQGNVTINNAYFDVDQCAWGGGALFRGGNGTVTTTLDNVIVNMAASDSTTGFYASISQNKTRVFTNCYFIGGSGQVYAASRGDIGNKYTSEDYKVYDTFANFTTAYANGEVTGLTGHALDALEKNTKTYRISSSNVAKLLNVPADSTIIITEDIDMATAYKAGTWTSNVDFYGTILGNNHVISNLKTNTGLFKNYYGGTIKDLAITNVNAIGSIGVLGANTDRNQMRVTNIDNIYVHVATATSNVGLFNTCNLTNPVNISNSVIVSNVANCGIWVKVASKATNVTNSYLVNVKPYLDSHYRPSGSDLSAITDAQKEIMFPSTNTAYSFADVAAMTEGYNGGLSEFIEKIVGL